MESSEEKPVSPPQEVGKQGKAKVVQFEDGSQKLQTESRPKPPLPPGATIIGEQGKNYVVQYPDGKQRLIPKKC